MDEVAFAASARLLASKYPDAEWVELPPGRALLIRRWLTPADAQFVYQSCLQQLSWDQPRLHLFGRQYPIPRRHAFVGDPGVVYRWSGLEQKSQEWTDSLRMIRSRLQAAGFSFNSVLVNHYRSGEDSMGWHADNEKELGDSPVIAIVSLGQERRLDFKAGKRRVPLDLPDGSLLLTSGAVQHHWLHSVPKTRRVLEGRISLTFRYIWGRTPTKRSAPADNRPTDLKASESLCSSLFVWYVAGWLCGCTRLSGRQTRLTERKRSDKRNAAQERA